MDKKNQTKMELQNLAPEVFEGLPSVIGEGVDKLSDYNSKTVFLYGGLGVMSGILPNVHGIYNGCSVKPNLYVYILGRYGGGKGALNFTRQLGQVVHQNKKSSRRLQIRPESETNEKKLPLLLYIPANISKTGFFELLDNNDGCGTLFETEGDTLADALRQDYGNFSDGLRKGFHHEPISYYRRKDSELVEIEHPCISVVLSSTFDQLIKLIPDEQNGLFSRFIYYTLPHDPTFQNVFATSKSEYENFFKQLGEKAAEIYNKLKSKTSGIEFKLTENQQKIFLEKFQKLKKEFAERNILDLDGTVHRLGLQFFRIAMILSVLRAYEEESLDDIILCTGEDFEITQKIAHALINNALLVYYRLQHNKKKKSGHPAENKFDQVKQAQKLRNQGDSYSNIAKKVLGKKSSKATVHRWLNSGKN